MGLEMEEGSSVNISKIPEALITYDQVLLSQINHCAKLSGLVIKTGSGTIHREVDLAVCVDSLRSLLPITLRKKVEEKIAWYRRWVFERASKYECFKKKTCARDIKAFERMIDEIMNEAVEEFPGYSHVFDGVLYYYLWPYDEHQAGPIIKFSQFKLTLIVDLLAEEGIIALKQPSLFVGGVRNVPEHSH
jgi:hypothetical protein